MSEQVTKILVCGGRTYRDAARIRLVLEEYVPADPRAEEPLILHGGARGADRIAAEEARELGFWIAAHPADWTRYGHSAGPIRNREMLDRNPDLVIAFGGNRGTDDVVREAKRRGIPVREVDR